MNLLFCHPDPHFIWPVPHDEHVKAWRWHLFTRNVYGMKS